MRLATTVFGICLAFIVVVQSFTGENKSCKKDEDCNGGCCRKFWMWKKCFAKRKLGEPCRPKAHMLEKFCHHRCKDGLVCRPSSGAGSHGSPDAGTHPDHKFKGYKCHRAPLPTTQEP